MMRSEQEIRQKLEQINEWLQSAERQRAVQSDLLEQIAQSPMQSEAYSELLKRLKALQQITIPGFCVNQDVNGICNLLQGRKDSLEWTLGDKS